jgi:hypothetical protein
MNFTRAIKNVSFALAAVAASSLIAGQALAGTVSVTGTGTTAFGTSNDSITLLAQDQALAITGVPTLFTLQTANFGIDFSVSQTVALVLNENVTINGVTRTIAYNFTDFITDSSDTLVLAPGAMTQFGNVNFQLVGTSVNSGALGNHFFNVQANISEVPEPASLAIFGLGMIGFAVSRRKSVK